MKPRPTHLLSVWLLSLAAIATLLGACAPAQPVPAPQTAGTQSPLLKGVGPATPDETAQAELFAAGAPVAAAPSPQRAATAALEAAISLTGAPTTAAAASPPAPSSRATPTRGIVAIPVQPPATMTPEATEPLPASPVPATPADQQSSLQEELFVAGAPSLALISRCTMPDQLADGEHAATWSANYNSGMLCLFGFGENESVRYEVRDAAGDIVAEGEGMPDNMDGDPLPSVKVMIDLAGNAPGDWTAHAEAPSGTVDTAFETKIVTLEGEPAISLVIRSDGAPVRPGSELSVIAYGLLPGQSVAIGVYDVLSKAHQGMQTRLHEGIEVIAGRGGAAGIRLQLDPSYNPGEYCLVVVAGSSYKPSLGLASDGATRCFEVAAQ